MGLYNKSLNLGYYIKFILVFALKYVIFYPHTCKPVVWGSPHLHLLNAFSALMLTGKDMRGDRAFDGSSITLYNPSSASFAAKVCASFLLLPLPLPNFLPAIKTSTVKTFLCASPSWLTTRYSGRVPNLI